MARFTIHAEIIVDADTDDHARAMVHSAIRTMPENTVEDYGLDVEYWD